MDLDELERLRQRLRELVPVVASADDFDGRLISRLGSALGRFGDKQDIPLLQQLIRQDIERVNAGRQLLESGIQQDPRVNGSRMRRDNWLIGALLGLAGKDCEKFLLELLCEPVYEDQAVRALFHLVRLPQEKSSLLRGGVQSYEVAAGLRAVPQRRFIDEEKRNFYADAVKQRLLEIAANGEGDSGNSAGKLKGLASYLSLFNREEDVQLILKQLSLEAKWDAWVVLDTIETLVFSGITLNAEEVKRALDPLVKKIVDGDEWYQPEQQGFLLSRSITILLFSDDPATAIELLSSLHPSKLRQHNLHDIVEIAGYSQSEEVASWLLSLLEDPSLQGRLSARILASLVKIGHESYEDAFLALLGLSDAKPIPIEMRRETIEPCASAMAGKVATDPSLKKRLIDKCNDELDPQQLSILASVINMAKDPELDLAALQLMRDGQSIPWPVHQIIKRAFYEEVPISGSQGVFSVNPIPNTTVRARLLEMAYDDEQRKESAYELLGKIDQWRLESGEPEFEPRHPNISSDYSWPILEDRIGICGDTRP
jgi:hypothetical protein